MDRIKFYSQTVSKYVEFLARALVLLMCISVISVPVESLSFQCGQDICKEKGYIACISPPQVLKEHDSYCLPCDQFKNTCDTADEQSGCHLYCRDLVKMGQQKTIKNLEQHNLRLKEDNKRLGFGLVASIICNAVLAIAVAILSAIFGYLRRRRRHACMESQSSSDCSATTPLTSSPGSSEISISTAEEANEESSACCRKDKGCYGDKALHNVNPVQPEDKGELVV